MTLKPGYKIHYFVMTGVPRKLPIIVYYIVLYSLNKIPNISLLHSIRLCMLPIVSVCHADHILNIT